MKDLLSRFSLLISILGIVACTKEEPSLHTSASPAEGFNLEVALPNQQFKGVNWADPRDNFVDGVIVPSGLSTTDSYEEVIQKSRKVLSSFKNELGANTIRLGINPNTVLDDPLWWKSYRGIIETATTMNMKVVLACWESDSSRNGKIDDTEAFYNMWQKVINKYKHNELVYFEVFNEPHGYSVEELKTIYAEWLEKFSMKLDRNRVLLGGNGYSENVKTIGSDPRFEDCLLSLHIYSWWGRYKVPADWQNALKNAYGEYAGRTILTEFGVPMTTGLEYNGPINDREEIAFLQGITIQLRKDGISSIYWPGYRTGDFYSIMENAGSDSNIDLYVTNGSGLSRLQFGWGANPSPFDPNGYYKIINLNSGLAIDVNQAATWGGASIIQWGYGGGSNQQWQMVETDFGIYKILNRNSGLAIDVNGGSMDAGANILQWYENGGFNQQWEINKTEDGSFKLLNRNSGHAMDVDGASTDFGASIIQWPWNNGDNQKWLMEQL